ncbi:pyruvate kinase [Hathewaya massiliensis]|uniref:pyruvate kinase n=1 Tax=Hathewaya massiliensis TaxID=1964382 RepID=UPI00115875CC|nr:pyruvate kinase [Hathewaya massiliensis]
MKKTKIVCTIGPASNTKEVIKKLMEAGMNASRHNFSHGTHETHKENMDMVKEVRKELNKNIAIILDTKGPEIRTGDFNVDKVELKEGSKFTIYCREEILGDESKCYVTYDNLCEDVKPGDSILIDDGLVGLKVESVEGNKINCVVTNSGVVSNHKGINVPGVSIKLPSLTEKDISDLKFGVEQGVDMIAASFVRTAEDVLTIRETLNRFGGEDVLIFSKIENREGVDNIDRIIKFSDGIMVARGDLGVEIPTEEVPIVQKMIIEKCNIAGKPVITATQMLDSMIRNPRPTRAEASDVANAILDGTDSIMLSGETANGKYPIEAVNTMARIAEKTENSLDYEKALNRKHNGKKVTVPDAISLATCTTAKELNATAIITATQSGHSARIVSKHRPECPIIAVTPYENVARKLALNWGVYVICSEKVETTDELIIKSAEKSFEEGFVKKGDLVVIAAGIPVNYVGSTNMLKVHIIGDILVQGKGKGGVSGYGTAKIANTYAEALDTVENGDILILKEIDENFKEILPRVNGIIVEGEADISILTQCVSEDIPIIYNAEGAKNIIKTGTFITMDTSRGVVYSGKASVK